MDLLCTFCGDDGHIIDDCVIASAAYCSFCCTTGLHYTVDCPSMPEPVDPYAKARTSGGSPVPENNLIINTDEKSIVSFLKKYNVKPSKKFVKNRKLVQETAKELGYSKVIFVNIE